MRTYKVIVADKFTGFPIGFFEVKAISKYWAKRIVFKDVCDKDKSYLIIATKMKGGA